MIDNSVFGKKELYAVVLLSVISFFIFADQNLMAPNLTQIGKEFGFTATERDSRLGGDISLMFWMLGGLITIAIGYLTDLIKRKTLFIWIIIIGEIPCLLTGFVQNYRQFFWMRALTGIAIGGALPITYSLLGDYFSHKQRASAAAFVGFAQGLGIAGGQLLAGFIGPAMGWRLPFILVALPNFLLIILFLLTVREPSRGRAEDSLKNLIKGGLDYKERINWSHYKELFRKRTNWFIFLQAIPGSVPWGVFFIYLNDYYAQEKGFSVEGATLIVMAIGAGAILGSFFGGLIGNKLYNKKASYQPLFCGISVLVGILPMAYVLNYPSQIGTAQPAYLMPVIVGFIAGIIITFTSPNMNAILLNVNTPETRGSVLSLFNLVNDLGKGFGPFIISILIVHFGRVWAFNISNLFWVFCGIVLLFVMKSLPKDQAVLNHYLQEKAKVIKEGVKS
jgi:MFS family permease